MADVSRTYLRGWLIPDDRVSTDTLAVQGDGAGLTSRYTQAGPEPGIPVATSSPTPDLTLRSHGVAVDTTYEAQIGRNGYPGRDSRDAGFYWRETGETPWIGWDRPFLRGAQGINVRPDGGAGHDSSAHVITMRYSTTYRGRIVSVTDTGSGGVDVNYQPAGTDTWVRSTVASDGDTTGTCPAIIELPSGRLVVYYFISGIQVRAMYSDNGGGSWALYASAVLPAVLKTTSGIATPATRMRAAYNAGEVLLLIVSQAVAGTEFDLQQYASGDDGGNFDFVTRYVGQTADGFAFPFADCTPTLGGGYAVAWVETSADAPGTPSPGVVFFSALSLVLGSAYQPITFAAARFLEAIDGDYDNLGVVTYVGSALCTDDDGTVWWVLTRCVGAGPFCQTLAVRSTDGGSTFETFAGTPGDFDPNNTGAFKLWGGVYSASNHVDLIDFSATWSCGQLVIVGKQFCNDGTHPPGSGLEVSGGDFDDDSLIALFAGGYSTQTVRVAEADDVSKVAWAALEKPVKSTDLWTESLTGAATQSIGNDGLTVVLTSAQAVNWTNVRTIPTTATYLDVTAGIQITSGSRHTAKSVYVRAALSDNATSEYTAELWIDGTGYTVRDVVAGTSSSLVAVDCTEMVDFRIEMNQSGQIVVHHRAEGTPGATAHKWVQGYSGTLTKDATPADATGVVRFGCATGAATEVIFKHLEYRHSTVSFALPLTTVDLLPRRITADPVEIDAGYAVSAVDGPAIRGDTWDLPIRYRHGIERMDPLQYPSPRNGWRSTVGEDNLPPESAITWLVAEAATRFLRSSYAVYLDGLNWRTGRLRGWTGSAWTTIIEIDTVQSWSQIGYSRKGDVLVVDVAGGSDDGQRWMAQDELVGFTVALDDGSLHRVVHNTSGLWKPGVSTGLRPEIRIDAVTGTEPASGLCDVWSTRWVGVVHTAVSYKAFQLVIDEQTTVEGDHRVSVCMVGPVIVIDEAEWGRSLETAPNISLTTRTDGSRSARRLGPPRRVLTQAWPQGIPTRGVLGDISVFPDYLSGNGTPIGAPGEASIALEGLILSLDGSKTPCVYLPSIPHATGTYAWTARELSIYGRITSSVSQETIVGDEDVNEVRRVLQIVHEEEV